MQTDNTLRSQKIPVFDIDPEGKVMLSLLEEHEQPTLDNTLLQALYPDINVAMVNVPTGFLDAFEENAVTNAMARINHNNKIDYRLIGASGSAKDGKFYLVDAAHSDAIAKRFQYSPEAAIVYFGILVSNCKAVLDKPDCRVLVVEDRELGTNDCGGWIDECLLNGTGLPEHRVYQFRVAFENAQAKGCFKVMKHEVTELLGADIILPASSMKPGLPLPKDGKRFRGRVFLGIRDVSERRTFGSSYSVVEHAPEDSIHLEILAESFKEVRRLAEAIEKGDYERLLDILLLEDPEETRIRDVKEQEMRIVEAVLLADRGGSMARFPYVANYLNKVLARWAFRASTGGSLRLPGFTLAHDGFLVAHNGRVYAGSDWIPPHQAIAPLESRRGLCVRYPVRSIDDLLPVEHIGVSELVMRLAEILDKQGCAEGYQLAEQIATQQLLLEGAYVLHSETAKKNGGDFDFDYVCELEEDRFPRFVQHRFARAETKHREKTKVKVRSLWQNLPLVAMRARGNMIGRITDLKTSCLAAGRLDLAGQLVEELQNALDSLKWNVEPDRKAIDNISKQVSAAPWLALKKPATVSKLPVHLEVAESDRIGKIYQHIRKEIPDLLKDVMHISEFKMLISGEKVTREMHDECRLVNSVFAAAVSRSSQRRERLNDAYERAVAECEEAALDSNKLLRKQKYEAKRKAFTARRQGQELARKEMNAINTWVRLWSENKKENRMGWLQALQSVVCAGNGTGAILLHAFPQEVVNRKAEDTNGRAVQVSVPDLSGFSTHTDAEGRTFLKEPMEDGRHKEIYLFRCNSNGDIFFGSVD